MSVFFNKGQELHLFRGNSASVMASTWSCVTNRLVMPSSRAASGFQGVCARSRRPGWRAARQTRTPAAGARWRGPWPRAGAGRPRARAACGSSSWPRESCRLVHACLDFVLGHLGDLQAVGHVVEHGHVRVQGVVLEHHGDVALGGFQVVDDLSPIRISPPEISLQPCHHAQERGFAAARRPDDDDNSRSRISALTPWITWLALGPGRSV